jgi:hypothetical protein
LFFHRGPLFPGQRSEKGAALQQIEFVHPEEILSRSRGNVKQAI